MLVEKYFNHFSEVQLTQFERLKAIYNEWNQKINVVSRKDMDQFEVHHVLHSLSIVKFTSFKAGTKVLDFGTGGGFPGIPLAIAFPEVQFTLVDSIGKKMKVVDAVVQELKLQNVHTKVQRVEEINDGFDFITCRAVARLDKILSWVGRKIEPRSKNDLKNGFIFLKGGDLAEEIREVGMPFERINISDYFDEDFFESKEIVYLPKHFK